MRPDPKSYAVYPSVVPVGKETPVVVAPAERTFLLYDGEAYRLTLRPIEADDDYYASTRFDVLDVTAEDGVLRFSYRFDVEGEYTLRIDKEGAKLIELSLYALEEDLYALSPLRGDFHAHSFRSDAARDPSALAGHFREQGYDFFTLTDHNRRYPGEEIDETFAGVKTGILRVPGEEIHTPGSVVHIVHVGGEYSVANRYIHEREAYESEVKAYEERVPLSVPADYRARYARAMWATDEIHKAGGLAVFAHPFWRPGNRAVNIPAPLARIFLSSGMFDAFELIGGGGQIANNRHVALLSEARDAGVRIPVVGASDVHVLRGAESFPDYFSICFASEPTVEGIFDAVRAGRVVAVEASGLEYARTYRAYGDYRLVGYAQYLLHNFFPNATRIAAGEGVAMRAYAMGEAPASLVEGMAALAQDYRDRFFGRKAPLLPDAEARATVARQRARHVSEGPPTCGSSVDPSPSRKLQR